MSSAAAALNTDPWPFSENFTASLLFDGTELPATNGYARPVVCAGIAQAVTWARSGAVATLIFAAPHGIPAAPAGAYSVTVLVTSDAAAIPLGTYVCTVTNSLNVEITVPNAGATTGTATARPPHFWAGDGDGVHANLVQALQINFPAASGANWQYNELRLHDEPASGGYLFSFKAVATDTVVAGDNLVIAAGTLKLTDATPELP